MASTQVSTANIQSDSQSDSQSENEQQKIRYAVIGLGWFAQIAALPAFANTENSELVALISDDSTKLQELSQKYGVQHTYSYDEYDECLVSGLIDAVYIALPNHMHCEYTVKAANAGIHVLCEKPMAIAETECEQMMHSCSDNGVKLMIAYRLHFEAANMEAVKIVQSGIIGEPRIFNSVFTQQVEAGDIRLQKATGGGTIDDIGIYCINAARYLFQSEPIEGFATTANSGEPRFAEVETTATAILRFPNERLATFTVSFGTAPVSSYRVVGTQGDLCLDPAYSFQGSLKHYLTVNGETQEHSFEPSDQLAAEFTYFSDCILQDQEPEPSGMEGLNDVRIIRALYQSAETGKPVSIAPQTRSTRPSAEQIIQRPAAQPPELVHATDPSSKH